MLSIERRFVREMRRSIAAGLPVNDALAALSESPGLRSFARFVLDEVERGSGLGEALSKRPRRFTPVYAALVEAGERSGRLVEAFDAIGDDLDAAVEVRRAFLVRSAYPLGLLAFTLIVPPLSLAAATGRVPGYFVSNLVLVGVIGIVALVCVRGPAFLPRGSGVRRLFERSLLAVPLLRRFLAERILWRPLRLEGALLDAGLGFEESLPLSRRTVEWDLLRERWDRWLEAVRKGRGAAEGARELELLGEDDIGSLARGERAGAFDAALTELGDEMKARTTHRIAVGLRVLPIFIFLLILIALAAMVFEVFAPYRMQ